MTLLLRHKKSDGHKFSKILILVLVLLFAIVFSVGRSSKNFFVDSVSGVFEAGDGFYGLVGVMPEWFVSRLTLLSQIEKLQAEVEALRLQNLDSEALIFENQRLKAELQARPEADSFLAGILARPPQTAFDTLVVNLGYEDGVEVGDLVLASAKTLVGQVVEVRARSSVVWLNSGSENNFLGLVVRTGETVEVAGIGGGNLSAKTLSDFDIKPGDSIALSDGSGRILAIVGVVESESSGGTKKVLMSLPFDLGSMQSVFILK